MKILARLTLVSLLFLCAAILVTACSPSTSSQPVNQKPQSNDIKTLFGADDLSFDKKLAKAFLPESAEEKKFWHDFNCFDENECYGEEKLETFMLSKYPEIKSISYTPESHEDDETIAINTGDFIRALFFAKEIKLANGMTLFDLITKCSKSLSNNTSASIGFNNNENGKAFFYLQYFPILKQTSTGEDFELNIMFNRSNDYIEAQSAAFSTNVLVDPDFMQHHGVACW